MAVAVTSETKPNVKKTTEDRTVHVALDTPAGSDYQITNHRELETKLDGVRLSASTEYVPPVAGAKVGNNYPNAKVGFKPVLTYTVSDLIKSVPYVIVDGQTINMPVLVKAIVTALDAMRAVLLEKEKQQVIATAEALLKGE